MNIYVGNLPFDMTDAELREAFEAYGQVSSAQVIKDRDSGKSRGFGFVEMPVAAEGQAAINALNGHEIDGRALKVNEARPKTEGDRRFGSSDRPRSFDSRRDSPRPSGGGYGGRSGGGGGSRGGGGSGGRGGRGGSGGRGW